MSTIPIHARSLPLYLNGLAAGRDIGLRLALEVITKELARQQDLEAVANASLRCGRTHPDGIRAKQRQERREARWEEQARWAARYETYERRKPDALTGKEKAARRAAARELAGLPPKLSGDKRATRKAAKATRKAAKAAKAAKPPKPTRKGKGS
jgi:hypothetical protein